MRVIFLSRTWLPNTLVRTIPVVGHIFAESNQYLLHRAIKTAPGTRKLRGSIDDFAICIQLQLAACSVTDSHRPGIAIPAKKGEFPLVRYVFAENVVHDAQFRLRKASCDQKPRKEALRFRRVPQPEQSANRK